MTAVLIVVFASIVICAVFFDPCERAKRAERRVVRDAQRADLQVGRAASEARRAMNRAAGQSWRNPFE